ncbi:MAG: hypothetical protein U9N54_08860 [candidate division Zixibacteria bacterium]|nr:hypothetical protein [candidate division Zixibacteria bacterium]
MEVLVLPLRLKKIDLAEQYRDILLNTDGLITCEISHPISELAANLRAKYLIRTPDSIQLATGIIHGAEAFITSNSNYGFGRSNIFGYFFVSNR